MMAHTRGKEYQHNGKNSLTIRLTEPVVFLRSDLSFHNQVYTEDRPSILRGLLVLNLTKPTKISSIEVELMAKTETNWAEGLSTRRMDFQEEHQLFRASTVYFHAGKTHSRRTASIGPGASYVTEHDPGSDDWEDLHLDDTHTSNLPENELDERLPMHDRTRRSGRYASVDTSHFHRHHVSHQVDQDLPRLPPYSASATSPLPLPFHHVPSPLASSVYLPNHQNGTGTPNDLINALDGSRSPQSGPSSPSLSLRSRSRAGRSRYAISRDPSISNALHDTSESDYSNVPTPLSSNTPRQQSPAPGEQGHKRRKSHFTLSAVSNALMHAVHVNSPTTDHFKENVDDLRRGRSLEKRPADRVSPVMSLTRAGERDGHRGEGKKDYLLTKVGEILKGDHKEASGSWKEFKKGTYTYPISFQVPGNSPPTMQCDFGHVSWYLRARVHRPGAFKTKYTASREVIMVPCPTEDDTEESDNIIVERQWDQQIQYLIAVSGKSFFIGGTMPVMLAILPLSKAKVYRLAVYLEERVDYYTDMRRIIRSSPIGRLELLSIRYSGKTAPPILPLDSDDPEAFRKSPLYDALASTIGPDDDISEIASSFMGPGPWKLNLSVKLPASCTALKPTNKNKGANMTVSHLLKFVMRIERGDDLHVDKNGKRKLFDIVVQAPVHILSCRCNPEWTSLPPYSETMAQHEPIVPSCPCQAKKLHTPVQHKGHEGPIKPIRTPALSRVASRESIDSNISTVDSVPIDHTLLRSLQQPDDLLAANTLFERLISGQQSVSGETPPAYEDTMNAARVGTS